MSAVAAAPRTDAGWRAPSTRPRGRLTFLLVLLLAAGLGLAVGLAPRPTLVVVAGVTAVSLLLLRLEWAVLSVVVAAVFADYLDLVAPHVVGFLTLLLVLAWLVRRSQGPIGAERWRPELLAAGLFLLVLAVATAVHPNGHPGLQVAGRYAALVVTLVVLLDALAGPVRAHLVARAYVGSCVLAAVCGLVTAAVDDRHRVTGPLGNPDDLAFFLVAAIPLAGVLRYRRRWHLHAVVVVLLLATLGTQSRGAMVALAAMVVVSVAIQAISLRAAAVWLVLIGTGVALVLAVVVPHALGDRLDNRQRYVETRVSERVAAWTTAGDITLHHPVVGVGPGGFEIFGVDYRHGRHATTEELDVAHSTPLQASSELGLLGAAALLAVFLVPVVGSRRRWLPLRSRLSVGTAVGLVGLLVASLFETEQYVLPLWLLAALAAPVAVGSRRPVGLPVASTRLDR